MDSCDIDQDSKAEQPRLVGDVGVSLDSARDKAAVGIPLVVYAFCIGFFLGALVCVLLSLANALVDLVWEGGRSVFDVAFYPVVVCCIGGVACGLWTKFVHPAPASLEEVMACVKRTGGYSAGSLPKCIVSFLLPLAFGGSVGPEAGLSGIIAALCTKIGSVLTRAGVRAKSVTDISIPATLSAVFAAPLLGALAGVENEPPDSENRTYRRGVKAVLYTATAFGALAGMQTVGLLPHTSSGLPRFAEIGELDTSSLYALVCLAAGWSLAALYFTCEQACKRIRACFSGHTVAACIVCGFCMGLVALVFPDVLFSGEEQVREAMEAWSSGGAAEVAAVVGDGSVTGFEGAFVLILTAVAKAVATPLCLNFGWRGGHFFPMIFAGASLGFGIAAATGADAMLCVTVVVSCLMGAVMRKPLAAGALLLLCVPVGNILWMAVAVFVGAGLPMPFAKAEREGAQKQNAA